MAKGEGKGEGGVPGGDEIEAICCLGAIVLWCGFNCVWCGWECCSCCLERVTNKVRSMFFFIKKSFADTFTLVPSNGKTVTTTKEEDKLGLILPLATRGLFK